MKNKVRVLAFEIDIIKVKPHELDNSFGEFCSLDNSIKIDCSVDDINIIDTLVHEINHAIYWAYHIEDADKQERIVKIMASAWVQVFKDNPWLLDFIKEKLHKVPSRTIKTPRKTGKASRKTVKKAVRKIKNERL